MHTCWNLDYPACHSRAWWVWWEALQISRSNSSVLWYAKLKGKDTLLAIFPAQPAMLISWTVLLGMFLACPACEVNQKVIVRGERAGRRQQELAEVVGVKRGRRRMLGVCRGFCYSDLGIKTTNLLFALEVLKTSGSKPKHPKLELCCLINPKMNNKCSAVLEHLSDKREWYHYD